MPKQKKPRASDKEMSPDTLGFWNLFTQTKEIIGKHLGDTESPFSWLQSFFREARSSIKNVGKDSNPDLSQLNATTVSRKDEDQTISSKQNEVSKKRKKRKSSKLHKSSISKIVRPVSTSHKSSDSVDFHNDEEHRDQNSSLQMHCDASPSQNTCSRISVDKLNGETQLYVRAPDDTKLKDSIVVPESLLMVNDSPELSKSMDNQNVGNHTSAAELSDVVQQNCRTSNAKVNNLSVVLERLTDGECQESVQCIVPPNDCDHTSVQKLSNEIQLKITRTSDAKCKDPIIELERLEIKQSADELGECGESSSGLISGKRKLSEEIRKSSHLVLESASRMSETRRRSSLMRVKIRSSKEFLMVTENAEPVNKKPKMSHSEKSFSSEASEDNKVSKPNSSDSDRGIGSTCSSVESGSGSQRSNTSTSRVYAKESLTAARNWHSVTKNGQINRKRSFESIGYKTPESNTLKKDFSNSTLRLQSYKPLLSSQSRNTPKGTFVFSSSKTTSHVSKSKLLSGSHSTKPCTPLQGGNTPLLPLRSQVAAHEAEKEKFRQEEARRQEKEQALLKKKQILQMKVEEQKRKREERMQKNLEARQQLEREKAERHRFIEQKEKKISAIAKEKEKLKEIKKNRLKNDSLDTGGPAKKLYNPKIADKVNNPMDSTKILSKEAQSSKPTVTVTKHITSETAKSSENKTVKPSEPQPAALNSTYVKNEESPSESYEMTPCRPRSTYCNYDISNLKSDDESEDECAPTKPVPAWAVGMRFKQALISQHYNPPNVDELFGSINIPDLSEMFTQKKARYDRRTSSAIWNTPDRCIFAVKSYS